MDRLDLSNNWRRSNLRPSLAGLENWDVLQAQAIARPLLCSVKSGFDVQETIIYKDTHAQSSRQLRRPGPSGSHSSLLGTESLGKIERDLARVRSSAFPYVWMRPKPWSDLSWTPNVLESLLQSAPSVPLPVRCPEDRLLSGRVVF